MASPTYNFRTEKENSANEIQFHFISKGPSDVIKAVQYIYVGDLGGQRIFNMGFGDYDIETDYIDDQINTENGDVYKVFNTVLNTIPSFFEIFPGEIMMVSGSDSKPEYIEKCKENCEKKCGDKCRKAGRRIGLYTGYVNKNFDNLSQEYMFYGGNPDEENPKNTNLESYAKNKKYTSVFVFKK